MKILVSACLLGVFCRYDGKAKINAGVAALTEKHTLIPFCPEIYGGLPTPREPSEIRDGRVYTCSGRDVTAEYTRGAEAALKIAKMLECECAILQDRSPSCGIGTVHNGYFDGGLISGDGITAAMFREAGIRLIPASEVSTL